MKVRMYSKITLGWDGKPEVIEIECKSVKVEDTKVTMFISENMKDICSTKYCDFEIVG